MREMRSNAGVFSLQDLMLVELSNNNRNNMHNESNAVESSLNHPATP